MDKYNPKKQSHTYILVVIYQEGKGYTFFEMLKGDKYPFFSNIERSIHFLLSILQSDKTPIVPQNNEWSLKWDARLIK